MCCSTLQYERVPGQSSSQITCKPQQVVSFQQPNGKTGAAKWLGFLDEEEGVPAVPHQAVKIPAVRYTCSGTSFLVEGKMAVKAYLLRDCGLLMVTREATRAERVLSKQHRQPKLVSR